MSCAILRAVVWSTWAETPSVATTVTCGTCWPAGSAPADAVSGRAGTPASTTTPANAAAAVSEIATVAIRPRLPTSRAQRDGPVSPSGRSRSSTGRIAHTRASEASTAILLARSVVCGAMRRVARSPTPIAYTHRAGRPRGIVIGSVIMKKRKIRISGEVTRSHQNDQPVIGPRCQRAVIEWPLAASTAMPAAKASQKPTAMKRSLSRERIAKPPTTMSASARAIHTDIGPHQKSSGSARAFPSARKQRTSPKFDGLKRWRPW